jgi:hypothetical protein
MNDVASVNDEQFETVKREAQDAVEVAAMRAATLADLVCVVAESGGPYAKPVEREKARRIIERMIKGEVEQALREGIVKGLDLAARFRGSNERF